MAVKDALWRLPLRLYDARRSRRCPPAERILIVQNTVKQRSITRDFSRWVERHVPELRARFEFRVLPTRIRDWSRYALVTFWGGDTLIDRAPWLYREAVRFTEACHAREIPVINPATRWLNAAKSRSAAIVAGAGLRTPRTCRVVDVESFMADRSGLPLPLLIREDRCHAQPSVLVRSHDELRRVGWRRFRNPIAVEFIDTRARGDCLYRKYRYIAVGGTGIAKHLMFRDDWEVRAEQAVDASTVAQEMAFISRPDANHILFQRARRMLGLDVVGFDYAYDRVGRVVVWEANPFPDTNYPEDPRSRHIVPATQRTFAAMARLYLRRRDAMCRPCWTTCWPRFPTTTPRSETASAWRLESIQSRRPSRREAPCSFP